MIDFCICPKCKIKLDIESVDDYGYGMECSNCHQKIDVFPTPRWIHTKWGIFGVPGNLLSLLFK